MMGKEYFKHSNESAVLRHPGFCFLLLLGLLFGAGCTTLHRGLRTSSIEPSSALQASLSTSQVASGEVVLVSVDLPQDLKGCEQLEGSFGKIQFPFFLSTAPTSSKSKSTPSVEKRGQCLALFGVPYLREPGSSFVLVRLHTGSPFGVKRVADPIQEISLPLEITPGDYPSELLQVDSRRVSPTRPKDLRRILREQAWIRRIYKKMSLPLDGVGPFAEPLTSKVTSPFGSRRVYNGQLKNFHTGADFRASLGTPIRSAARGRVVLVRDLFYTGNTVIVDHGFGVITLYAHLSRFKVKEGQQVGLGSLVGLSGQTGRVNGPHLHWQAVVQGETINPLGLIKILG